MGNMPPRPPTTFRAGDGSAELMVNYPTDFLLFDDGFWRYCQDHVPVPDPRIFNGPYEGGQISPRELEAFILAVRHWADHYDGLEDTVYSDRGRGSSDAPEEIEAMPEELAYELRRIEEIAVSCQAKGIPLGFST